MRVVSPGSDDGNFLPAAIVTYRETHPDVFFSVETRHLDGICTALLESGVDVGLAFDPDEWPGIAREVLG